MSSNGPTLASADRACMLLIASRADHANPLERDTEADVTLPAMHRTFLVGTMIAVVVAIAGLAYWDAERESKAAFQDPP